METKPDEILNLVIVAVIVAGIVIIVVLFFMLFAQIKKRNLIKYVKEQKERIEKEAAEEAKGRWGGSSGKW